MTIKQVLKSASDKIKKESDSPWLDAEVLLNFILKFDRAWLYAHPEKKLTRKQYLKFKKLTNRRLKHEPVAYITARKEFYDLDFYVDKNVLIPRPDTELLVEEILKIFSISTCGGPTEGWQHSEFRSVADIGTGSGCIACALAKNIALPVQIYATDISSNVLKIAKKNAQKNKVLNKINFLKGDLLESLIKVPSIDIIIANLPYLTTRQWHSVIPEIRLYEPRQALDGGKDGLNYIKKLLFQASQRKGLKTIILEMEGKRQANKIKKIAKKYWPKCKIKIKKDFRNLDRLVIISI